MVRLRVDRRAMHARRLGNFTGRLERIEIEDGDAVAARNIQATSIGICGHVVEAAGAADLGRIDHFVGSCRGRLCERARREQPEGRQNEPD